MDDSRKSLLECISLVLDYEPMREGIAEALELTVEQVNPSLVDSPEWPTIANSLVYYVEDQFLGAGVECLAFIKADGVNAGERDPDYRSYVLKLGPIFLVTENVADLSFYFGNFDKACQMLSCWADWLYDNDHGDLVREWRFDGKSI